MVGACQVCFWVATEIVLTPNPKQRSVVIERFIDLAHLCFELRNFNALMAIHMALNLSSVSRLKAGWKGVSPKHLQKLKEIGVCPPCMTAATPVILSTDGDDDDDDGGCR